MKPNDVDQPMGNAELRLTLQKIEEKVDETVNQSTKTNGSIAKASIDIEHLKRWRTGLTYAYIVFMVVILPILGFTLLKVWDTHQLTTDEIQAATQTAIIEAFQAQELQKVMK